MKRMKRYDDGGEVDALEAANQSKESQELAGEAILKGMRDLEEEKPSTFKEAFAAARKAGDKTFEFGGKKFTTEMASSKPAKVTDTGDETSRLAARKPRVKGAAEFGPEITYPRKVRSPYESRETSSEPAKPKEERLLKNLKMAKPSEFTGMGSMKFAKGGSVSSASKRADGIATKGKTKGRMC